MGFQPDGSNVGVRPVGATLMAVGDSITANGWSASASAQGLSTGTQAWLMWACLYSKGALTLTAPSGYSPAAATGGYTTAQILSVEAPIVSAYSPALCAVLGGANDIATSVPLATTIANLTAIYQTLIAAGTTPVLCTMTPRTGPPSEVTALNTWIKRYARQNRLPLVDMFQAVVDTTSAGVFLSTLTSDGGGHPNGAGAKLMGQTFWNALQYFASPESLAPLAGFNLKTAGDTIDLLGTQTQNSLFLLDSNSDGIPDGWTLSGTGATGSLATPASVGNYWKVTRGSADAAARVTNAMTSASVGDRLLFVCELTTTVEASSGAADCYVTDNAFGSKYAGFTGWDKDIPSGSVLSQEFTWTGSANLQPRVQVDAVTAANASISVARTALYNLTKGGVA